MPEVWTPERNPYDVVLLENVPSPGLAEIVGLSSPRKLMVQTGMGWNDAIIRFAGFKEQKFTVKLHLYTEQDWADWHAWKGLVSKRLDSADSSISRRVASAMSIYHPFLADPTIGVKAVIVEDVSAPVRGDDTGEWVISIDFVSFRRPKMQFATYDKTKDSAELSPKEKRIAENSETISKRIQQRLAAP